MVLNLTYRCHGVSRSGVRKVKKPVWKNKYIGKVCQSSGQPCMQYLAVMPSWTLTGISGISVCASLVMMAHS